MNITLYKDDLTCTVSSSVKDHRHAVLRPHRDLYGSIDAAVRNDHGTKSLKDHGKSNFHEGHGIAVSDTKPGPSTKGQIVIWARFDRKPPLGSKVFRVRIEFVEMVREVMAQVNLLSI